VAARHSPATGFSAVSHIGRFGLSRLTTSATQIAWHAGHIACIRAGCEREGPRAEEIESS